MAIIIFFSLPAAASDDSRHATAQLHAHEALHALHRAFVQSLNDATAPLIAAANAKQANEKVHGGTGLANLGWVAKPGRLLYGQ